MFSQTLRRTIFIGLFLVPFIPFLVSSAFFFPFIVTKAFAWRIIVEIVFAAWILLALQDVTYRRKKSVILFAIAGFLAVIGLADLLGVEPVKSFWSNFERMEGYITLLHLGMFFAVISSVFTETHWKRWWNTSLAASFVMVLYCVLQLIGLKNINQGGVRLDGTFGNAIYLAVYMIFHIFIATLYMWKEWKNVALRWVYGLLIVLQVFILYSTATRGAILGLLGGFFVMAVLGIWNREDKLVRKGSIAILVGLVVLVGGFFAFKDAAFVTSSPVLSRFSSLTASELKTQGRYFVWPMALEGVKEKPILGWGQDNFNFVFQEHYTPDMYILEPWFDRAHNIFLDWAVAGGILGLLSYLFLYVALLYSIWKSGTTLSHTEKSIFTGLIAAYFFHNFFVFDHLISYILFFSLLAYIHSRSVNEVSPARVFTESQVRNFALPVVSILLILILWFVNVKPLRANIYIIEALKALQTPGEMLRASEYFKKAHGASRLGRPEVVEHMSSNISAILTSDITMAEKNAYYAFAKGAVLKQVEDYENDARYQLVAGSFLSTTSTFEEAIAHLERAKELMPGKQQIYFELGAAYVNNKKPVEALAFFKQAYDMAPEYLEARVLYLVGAIYAGDKTVESEMIAKLSEKEFVFDDRILSAYASVGREDKVKIIVNERIRLDPANEANYKQYLESLAN